MAVPGLFVPHSVHIDTAGGVLTWIDQIQGANLNAGIDLFEESGSGEPDREYTAVRERAPVLDFETTDIAALSTCGLNGLSITPDVNSPGVVVWGKFVIAGGTRDAIAAVTHLKMACSDGMLIPMSLQGSHNRAAKLTYALHAIKGFAAQSGAYPMVFTKDTAIISGGGITDILFVPAVVKYTISGGASKLVTGVLSIALQFGIQLFKVGGDGEVDMTYIAIQSRNPRFEFSTLDGELLDDVGEAGQSCSSFAVYFQKVNANGERVAKATAEHVSVIATKGILVPGAQSLPHNQPGEGRYTFTPVKDTNILTIAVNATIPTS